MSWSEGYFSGMNYMHGYYKGLNPLWMRFACLFAGLEPPAVGAWNYLELGYGQGLSLSIHAAANEGEFWGTDFNPSHAAEARALTDGYLPAVQILDEAFGQLSSRRDLPQFDFIGLHGVWSWISEENRSIVLEIIRTRLRVGGLVYISYNCLPGWSPMVPLRELMVLHHQRAGRMGGAQASVDSTIAFAKKALSVQPGYLNANPTAALLLDRMASSDMRRDYIAHEYLNDAWSIPSFAGLAEELASAKLSFACSLRPSDNIDQFRLSPEAKELIDGIGDPLLRETVKDFCLNTRFRSDIFIKGPRPIPTTDFRGRWLQEHFVLLTPECELPDAVQMLRGKISLKGGPTEQVVALLAADAFRPKKVVEIMEQLADVPLQEIIDALVLLSDTGHAAPSRMPCAASLKRCKTFNRRVLDRALFSCDIEYLASPVTGGGIHVSHLGMLFIQAWEEGKRNADELCAFASAAIVRIFAPSAETEQQQRELREQLERIAAPAKRFLDSQLPLLRALVIV